MEATEQILWSNSTLKSLRTCERQFHYRHVQNLEPASGSYAMERGSWFHHCIAAHDIAKGIKAETILAVPTEIDLRMGDVPNPQIVDADGEWILEWADPAAEAGPVAYPLSALGMLQFLTEQVWEALPEDMKGGEVEDLPDEVRNLLERYLFHHREDTYDVLLVEHRWTRQDPVSGRWFTGMVDLVKRTKKGLVVVSDRKTHANLPDSAYRLTDSQLHLYAWGVEPYLNEHDLSADAIEFDYVVTRAPVKVKFKNPTKRNGMVSGLYADTKKGNMDELTFARALKEKRAEMQREITQEDKPAYILDEDEIEKFLTKLREQDNPFFRRSLMPRTEAVAEQLVSEHVRTIYRGIDLLAGEEPTRSVDFFGCRRCSFAELCMGELYQNDVTPLLQAMGTNDGLPMIGESDDE